ncbi:hypothetical protein D3C74_409080 [compost metagenome]
MMHLLTDRLELIGKLCFDSRSAQPHLIQQPLDRSIHAAGTEPGKQNGQQQHHGTDNDCICSDFARLLGQSFNGGN